LKTRRLLYLGAAALMVTSACGVFGSNKPTPTTLLGEGDGVGAGLTTPTTATSPTGSPSATTAAVDPCPYKDPVSEIEYGGRLRLTLTVSALCPRFAEDITLTLKVTNLSQEPINYDKNQAQFFSFLAYPKGSGRRRWEDTNCQPASRDRNAPAATLAAGQSLTFSTLYPAPKSVANRETCRRLEVGGYEANAVFLACEGEAFVDGYCDIYKDTQYKAQPVRIDVRA
jgi:hypothetical protein